MPVLTDLKGILVEQVNILKYALKCCFDEALMLAKKLTVWTGTLESLISTYLCMTLQLANNLDPLAPYAEPPSLKSS